MQRKERVCTPPAPHDTEHCGQQGCNSALGAAQLGETGPALSPARHPPCPSRPGSRTDTRGGCRSGRWAACPGRRSRWRSRRRGALACRRRRTWSSGPRAPSASPRPRPPPRWRSTSRRARRPAARPRTPTRPPAGRPPWPRTPPCAAACPARGARPARQEAQRLASVASRALPGLARRQRHRLGTYRLADGPGRAGRPLPCHPGGAAGLVAGLRGRRPSCQAPRVGRLLAELDVLAPHATVALAPPAGLRALQPQQGAR